ncbi:MAG: L-serine ammonia-lyase [Steroidobacteraceae bacterium]
MISVFDLFKIGIGPSSSHTVGPMVAARRFRASLPPATAQVRVSVYGSLAWTGHGHGTDAALCLGLLDQQPDRVELSAIPALLQNLQQECSFTGPAGQRVAFDPQQELQFDRSTLLPLHSNGMRFVALDAAGNELQRFECYSIGGGFIAVAGDSAGSAAGGEDVRLPYPFASAAQLLQLCSDSGLSIAELQHANERVIRSDAEISRGLDALRAAMFSCIDRGLAGEGLLPGRLKVRRRAKALHDQLLAARAAGSLRGHEVMDFISAYAIAVNEENAAGGRVVTAPTNGAAGIVPAVLRYYHEFIAHDPTGMATMGAVPAGAARDFLLTAGAIGTLIKRNASISGAEVGCQGEVGAAAAMAAAGLAAVLGATPAQVENAAEIAMEHHLGLTCDPIGGLVQVPCIERNAFGANKAIAAASLALKGDGRHLVSLDRVIETMRQTGADMLSKYKETAQGGLAVNVPEC